MNVNIPGGAAGPQGATGPQGAAGAGAIIPFASGSPVVLTTVLGGLTNTGALLGFGSSIDSVNVTGLTLNLGAGGVLDYAFVVPRAGTVTSIGAFFSTTADVTQLAPVTISAQLYLASPGSSSFSPVGTPVLLNPPLGPVISVGQNRNNVAAQVISVSPGDKLLMVFSINTAGLDIASVVTGFASAGITID
ncbi:exosporium glycoprotein BclB-related protein [Neobacillus bataviensis]|uniref:exosporium glycoprotein BclB-related protein n=1 Tax=Neobacillus bataviensis TaxID=220685 RepID=UPI0016452272|nr:exosporium glycoprotein BclB-related protein [Neobacillus bataviensis]